jgi:hypothetical protein
MVTFVRWFIAFLFGFWLIAINGNAVYAEDRKIVLMFQVQKEATDSDLALLRSLGINTIQSFKLSFWPDAEIRSFLARADQNSLKVIVTLNHFITVNKGTVSIDEVGLRSFINTYKSYSAIFAWHPIDEPSGSGIGKDTLATIYKKIKMLDRDRPIMITWNGTNQADYDCCFSADTFDILCIEDYINNEITWSQANLVKLIQRYNIAHKPVIIMLRAFGGAYPVKWMKMTPDSLEKQYGYFFDQLKMTDHIGFYGWELGPNIGISQDPEIKNQFVEFMKKHYSSK